MKPWKATLLALAMVPLVALNAAPATAQQPVPELALEFQPQSSVGEKLAIGAYLLDPVGNPISGQVVTFHIDAEFMNTLGRIEIGQATTDETGLALLAYTPKSEGEQTITARFAGNEVFARTDASKSLLVTPGPETYTEETPFRIPGANIGIVVAVLVTVWTLYLGVMGLFWRISRAGDTESPWTEVGR